MVQALTWLTSRIIWIYLDHDQTVTGSFGVAYTWNESAKYSTRVYVDALYGSGLRTDATASDGSNDSQRRDGAALITRSTSARNKVSKLAKSQMLKARLDVVNVTDNIYELRDGSGVGVNAAQYGERLGFFGSLSYVF